MSDVSMDELNMSVSAVCMKDGEKYAFVSFNDGNRFAEGKIPDCKIVSNKGFSNEEVKMLELYMIGQLKELKKMAAGVRLIDAFMD